MTIPNVGKIQRNSNTLPAKKTKNKKMVNLLWKTICQFPKKLYTHLLYDLVISHLGVYLRKMKICVHTKTCILMFMAALLVRASN